MTKGANQQLSSNSIQKRAADGRYKRHETHDSIWENMVHGSNSQKPTQKRQEIITRDAYEEKRANCTIPRGQIEKNDK